MPWSLLALAIVSAMVRLVQSYNQSELSLRLTTIWFEGPMFTSRLSFRLFLPVWFVQVHYAFCINQFSTNKTNLICTSAVYVTKWALQLSNGSNTIEFSKNWSTHIIASTFAKTDSIINDVPVLSWYEHSEPHLAPLHCRCNCRCDQVFNQEVR